MARSKYDIRMPRYHRLALIMAENRDFWEEKDRNNLFGLTRKKKKPDERRCPKCKSIYYAVCSMKSC
ncbi:MAG: hypothetical protein ACRD5H_11850, partial [Nitrososphaerales archaeon]